MKTRWTLLIWGWRRRRGYRCRCSLKDWDVGEGDDKRCRNTLGTITHVGNTNRGRIRIFCHEQSTIIAGECSSVVSTISTGEYKMTTLYGEDNKPVFTAEQRDKKEIREIAYPHWIKFWGVQRVRIEHIDSLQHSWSHSSKIHSLLLSILHDQKIKSWTTLQNKGRGAPHNY